MVSTFWFSSSSPRSVQSPSATLWLSPLSKYAWTQPPVGRPQERVEVRSPQHHPGFGIPAGQPLGLGEVGHASVPRYPRDRRRVPGGDPSHGRRRSHHGSKLEDLATKQGFVGRLGHPNGQIGLLPAQLDHRVGRGKLEFDAGVASVQRMRRSTVAVDAPKAAAARVALPNLDAASTADRPPKTSGRSRSVSDRTVQVYRKRNGSSRTRHSNGNLNL